VACSVLVDKLEGFLSCAVMTLGLLINTKDWGSLPLNSKKIENVFQNIKT
jgi:hypothetical protein